MSPAQALGWTPPGVEDALERAIERLRASKAVVVAAHRGPDGDAVGSVVAATQALRAAGVSAEAWSADPLPDSLRFVVPDGLFVEVPSADADVLLLLDCCELARAGVEAIGTWPPSQVVCLDHHRADPSSVSAWSVHDPAAASCTELVYRLCVGLGVELTPEIATALYVGLVTDTGSFRYASTHAGTMALAGLLLEAGVQSWEVCSRIWESQPAERLRILSEVLGTFRREVEGQVGVLRLAPETQALANGDPSLLHGLVNYARSVAGVEVAILLRRGESPDITDVVFRSRGRVNVAMIAERFGGGGHHNAAGCRISGTFDEVHAQLVEVCRVCLEAV